MKSGFKMNYTTLPVSVYHIFDCLHFASLVHISRLRYVNISIIFFLFISFSKINVRETEGAIKMDNPEKLERYDTQDEEKQNKTTRQYVLDIIIRKQTKIAKIRHKASKTTGGKDEPKVTYSQRSLLGSCRPFQYGIKHLRTTLELYPLDTRQLEMFLISSITSLLKQNNTH